MEAASLPDAHWCSISTLGAAIAVPESKAAASIVVAAAATLVVKVIIVSLP